MKKPLLALAVLSALGTYGAAHAQSNVNIYGLIDVTLSTVNNSDANGGRLTGFQTPWFSGSRLGFKGAEDLGDGLKAIYKLEAEYLIPTGGLDDPSQLFGRDSWVGVESASLGKLTVGYQNAVGRDFAASYLDPYGAPSGTGQLILAFDPAAFGGDAPARFGLLAASIEAQPGARLPGTRRLAAREKAKAEGLTISEALMAAIEAA